MLSIIWGFLVISALIYALFNGTLPELSAAVTSGADDAVKTVISLTGSLCLWSGVTEVISRVGGLRALGRFTRPLLRRLFRSSGDSPELLDALSANMAANLLGLGNAATPAGIRAAAMMRGRDLAALVVLNSSSLQLIPTTAAALRGSLGAANPFDILPAVWCSSAAALAAGLGTLALLRALFGARG